MLGVRTPLTEGCLLLLLFAGGEILRRTQIIAVGVNCVDLLRAVHIKLEFVFHTQRHIADI